MLKISDGKLISVVIPILFFLTNDFGGAIQDFGTHRVSFEGMFVFSIQQFKIGIIIHADREYPSHSISSGTR